MVLVDPSRFPFPWALPVVGGTLLLLGGVHASRSHPLRQWLAKDAAVWIGKRSYSLYLWHWPIFVPMRWTSGLETLLEQVIATTATFLVASASYRMVELPLRHNARIQSFRPALRIAGFLVVVLVGRAAVQRLFWRADSIRLSVVSRQKTDWYAESRMPYPDSVRRVCSVNIEVAGFHGGSTTTFQPQRCGRPARGRTLAVIGDSHARMFFPMLEELSAEEGVLVKVYLFPGCPFLPLSVPMSEWEPASCAEFMQVASRQVQATVTAGDMVFLPSLRLRRFGDQWGPFEGMDFDSLSDGSEARRRREKSVKEAVSWLSPFADRGIAMLFSAPTPMFKSPAFRCSDWFNAGNPVCRAGSTQPRGYLEHLRAPIVEAMEQLTRSVPGLSIWDPFPILCPTETCAAVRDGRPLFFDGDHLTGYGNLVLFPSFKAATAPRS